MTLRPVPQPADMPPSWDGVPVTWTKWSNVRTTAALHLKPENMACTACGSIDERLVCFGIPQPEPGAVVTVPKLKRTRSGKPYEVLEEVPARPVRALWAYRCRHCGHDQVEDRRTGELWDLDPDDYGPGGSTPADTLF